MPNYLANGGDVMQAGNDMATPARIAKPWYENNPDHYVKPVTTMSYKCRIGAHRAQCSKLNCSCECHKGGEK